MALSALDILTGPPEDLSQPPRRTPVFPKEDGRPPEQKAIVTELEKLLGKNDLIEASGPDGEQITIARDYLPITTVTIIAPCYPSAEAQDPFFPNDNIHSSKITTFEIDTAGNIASHAEIVIAWTDQRGVLRTSIHSKNVPVSVDLLSLLKNVTIHSTEGPMPMAKKFSRATLDILQNANPLSDPLNLGR